jgi:tripartite-type tricarboxylate transporter receptor subunit TctC
MRLLSGFITSVTLAAVVTAASGQNQPGGPIRLVVPQVPGGTNDTLGRIVAERLAERLGRQIVVDNRAGGNSQIGSAIVARAAPDGRTLLITGAGHAINPALDQKLPYDTERDFAPVGRVGGGPYLLVIHPSVTAHTTKEFIAWVKARPGQVNYASAGIGNPTHLAAELFNLAAGTDMRQIPYKGGAAVLPDLIAGRVTAFFSSITTAQTHVASGRLRPIAVTTARRSPFAPDVPTLAESGVKGAEVDAWYGILTTGKTPRAIVGNLSTSLRQVLSDPATREAIQKHGITPDPNTADEFAELIRSDIAKWTKVVRATGIKAE